MTGEGPIERPSDVPLQLSYVLPVRWQVAEGLFELTCYLSFLARICEEVVVVNGSPAEVFRHNAAAWGSWVVHIRPDPGDTGSMGKVAGVHAGVRRARCQAIVLADDDVRYDREGLQRVLDLLAHFDVVSPQNYFDRLPWRARWDTARTLVNRAFGGDYSGSLGLRRARMLAIGGYDAAAIFDNLELIRTIEAHGGRLTTVLDLYVRRSPPTIGHFWSQRRRYAYEEFARPWRMLVSLAILPAAVTALANGRGGHLVRAALSVTVLAEHGRRVHGGREVFPATSSLLAPLWILERGVCAWLAVAERQRLGGLRYHGQVVFTAAHSRRVLRKRAQSSNQSRQDSARDAT